METSITNISRLSETEIEDLMKKSQLNIEKHYMNANIEFVSIDILDKCKEYNRVINPGNRNDYLLELIESIKSEGIKEPGYILFNPKNGYIKLGEGNHRLAILKQLGLNSLPVFASRSQYMEDGTIQINPENITPRQDMLIGGNHYLYYWSEMKPSFLGEPFGSNYERPKDIQNKLKEKKQSRN